MRPSKARSELSVGLACHMRWVTYEGAVHLRPARHTPEVGAGCGKAARPVLCGGRIVICVPYRDPDLRPIVDRSPDRSVRARLRIRLLLRILDAQSGRLHHLSRRYDERQAGSDHQTGAFARAARSPNGGGSVCPRRSPLCALARRRLGCYARISAVAYPQPSPGVAQQLVGGTPV